MSYASLGSHIWTLKSQCMEHPDICVVQMVPAVCLLCSQVQFETKEKARGILCSTKKENIGTDSKDGRFLFQNTRTKKHFMVRSTILKTIIKSLIKDDIVLH